ncbi:MAG: hypothetical protein A2010_13800 [Nitrospirae bacterium GWD2_57_9]|nr:MAG: hypothetical protein A2010_13800 [Nitrospirae bacterium GWD2_57_9]
MLHEHKETIPSIIRDYPDWHRGRKEYHVWLIELGSEEILQKVEAAREHLSGYLLEPYRRLPHITLFVCGFPAYNALYDDDYTREQLLAQTQLLGNSKIKPFQIEICGLNSFASAPFLEVHDREGGIESIRSLLSSTAVDIGRQKTFTPHITVGLYSGAFCSKEVGRRIAAFSEEPVGTRVERITLGSYQAEEIAGALNFKFHVPLRQGEGLQRDTSGCTGRVQG